MADERQARRSARNGHAVRCYEPGIVPRTHDDVVFVRMTGLDSFSQDCRSALRMVTARPWQSLLTVGILALAIGITTTTFTIVDALMLRAAPFRAPEQLARLSISPWVSPAVLDAWRRSPAFSAVEAAAADTALVATDTGEVTRNVAHVTPGIFRLLGGVRPLRGRLFDAIDGRPGSSDRVVVSETVWRDLFGGDADLVGRRISIDGEPVVIVGIVPSDFRFPRWNTEIWRAADFATAISVTAYVRFAPNVPRADALRMAVLAAKDAHPSGRDVSARATPLAELHLDDYYRRAVPLLAGGVVLLFVVLCANASSLLLAGMIARGREIGTRVALGASRARLVRHVLIESAIVGAGGIVVGAGLAWALVSGARAVLPQAALLHSLNPIDIDARALLATSIVGLVATLAAGLLPAVIGTRADVTALLHAAGRTGTEAAGARLVRRGLLACQIALSCTLLLGATLLARSFVNLITMDRGLDTSGIVVATVVIPAPQSADSAARAAMARAVADQVRALPGVTATSWSYGAPPLGGINPTGSWTSDAPGATPIEMRVNRFMVDDEFFRLYRLPILRGRSFHADEPAEAIVSERFARALWPDADPIGRRFTVQEGSQKGGRFHVVGVVRELRYPSLDRRDDAPQWYSRWPGVLNLGMLSLRCDAGCPGVDRVRRHLMDAQPGLQIRSVNALEAIYAREIARPRAAAALAVIFAATALVAAAIGLYGLLSHTVARRRREFGIRSPLGASPGDIRRLVTSDAVRVTFVGIVIGMLSGAIVARGLTSLLYNVTAADPLAWTVVVTTIAGAVAAASWHPTRAAIRAAPIALLREE